jgi:hypothetical protein
MSRRTRFLAGASLGVVITLLGSCYPFLGTLPAGSAAAPTIQHVPYSGSFTYTLDAGATAHDVYFVFTNPDTSADVATAPTVASGAITVDGKSLPAPAPQQLPSYNSAPSTLMQHIAEFNRNPLAYINQANPGGPQKTLVSGQLASADTVGGPPQDFRLSQDGVTMVSVTATCRLVEKNVPFADGRTRSLSIWVADTNWNAADGTLNAITPALVTALAAKFLHAPAESLQDIYHWDTSVVGEPWGPQNNPSYIQWDTNNTITILLADLNQAYSGSVTVGYFWSKDNVAVSSYTYSNQRIMFYIDATLYATVVSPESSWGPTNYWPKFVFSTLAHEFQHMIQFYQKQVLHNLSTGTDTWINEMCSMLMEDLVADKQGVEGPRGVSPTDPTSGLKGNTLGRIPLFNGNSYLPLAVTYPATFDLNDYSVAYAFGAWLARNFGGASLLRTIVQSAQTDSSAVVDAVAAYTGNTKLTFSDLLEQWSAAVLLSDTTNAPPGYQYNTGTWFASTVGGESFNLGSIDFTNYTPSLTVFKPGDIPPAGSSHSSNLYFEAAAGLSGSRTWKITVPAGVQMNVVLR